MTASRVKHESKTILDLSKERLSKNKVIKLLRETEIKTSVDDPGTYIDNDVRVGIYSIKLLLSPGNGPRLKNYGRFGIRLYEIKRDGPQEIYIEKDPNFKSNDWVKRNAKYELRTNDLVSAILYCKRLDKLKLFN